MFLPKIDGLAIGEALDSGFEGRIASLEIQPFLLK